MVAVEQEFSFSDAVTKLLQTLKSSTYSVFEVLAVEQDFFLSEAVSMLKCLGWNPSRD